VDGCFSELALSKSS